MERSPLHDQPTPARRSTCATCAHVLLMGPPGQQSAVCTRYPPVAHMSLLGLSDRREPQWAVRVAFPLAPVDIGCGEHTPGILRAPS